MKTLPRTASKEQILSLVHKWVALLATEKYETAFNLTAHDPYYQWSPKLIKEVISGYGLPEPHPSGEIFKVTPIETASGDNNQGYEIEFTPDLKQIEESSEKTIGSVRFDLPLNNEWSDLTSTFEIKQNGNEIHLVLNEIHVF